MVVSVVVAAFAGSPLEIRIFAGKDRLKRAEKAAAAYDEDPCFDSEEDEVTIFDDVEVEEE